MNEERLAGGHMNTVVRVGDTVRRSVSKATPTVHRLLRHVRARGIGWVPEPFGLDERGREVLSFLPGDVPHDQPSWLWSTQVLADAAGSLRAWHDATVDFDGADAQWNLHVPGPREVICHNDFAPYNCVFRERRLSGVIDFDLCSPGSRAWDLAYTAYRFVPLMPGTDSGSGTDIAGERSPFGLADTRARLLALTASYAGRTTDLRYPSNDLLQVVERRLHAIADWTERHAAATGDRALSRHAPMYRAHACWVVAHLRTTT